MKLTKETQSANLYGQVGVRRPSYFLVYEAFYEFSQPVVFFGLDLKNLPDLVGLSSFKITANPAINLQIST
ncbi:hypothetical protein F0A16_07805 [Salinicola corii]|uniref:Uncharacterized protein n=1 Tax=Salinicola corii TaxID=2606937 RepID=A0A640WG80_9GAMM|nr:hypothetical protein [Salinicola corii]KAA0019230.1 hypothetical protein F0A16_07805 [Salinicola corii]